LVSFYNIASLCGGWFRRGNMYRIMSCAHFAAFLCAPEIESHNQSTPYISWMLILFMFLKKWKWYFLAILCFGFHRLIWTNKQASLVFTLVTLSKVSAGTDEW